MDWQLRTATIQDLDAIYKLETEGFVPGIVEERGVFEQRLQAFAEGFLLAEVDQRAAGYFCSEIWTQVPQDLTGAPFSLNHDPQAFLDRGGATLYIASMTMALEYRGRGLGEKLFLSGIAWMRERFPTLENGLLIVNEDWKGAHSIYSKSGFQEVGRLEDFFQPVIGPARGAIVMRGDFLQEQRGAAADRPV